jgi:hypothetical protein
VQGWPRDAWLKSSDISNDGQPDDVLQCYLSLPVFSSRLKQALQQAGIMDIEYLPILVMDSSRRSLGTFWVVNVLRFVEALDMRGPLYTTYGPQRSEIDPQDIGKVSGIKKAVLVEARLKEYHVIRLAEFFPSIFVSELFKKVFEEGSFTGYEFRRVKTV